MQQTNNQGMQKSIIQQTRDLPPGVLGNVLTFIPRNETAQLMIDAHKQDTLKLKYLRKYNVEEGPYKIELYSTFAPSVTGCSMYGDDDSTMKITRSSVSVGEKLRMLANGALNVSTVARTLTYEEDEGFIEFE